MMKPLLSILACLAILSFAAYAEETIAKTYYENGKIMSERMPDGINKEYYESGKLKSTAGPGGIQMFDESGKLSYDEKFGQYKRAYYKGGNLNYEYAQSAEVNTFKKWDSSGDLISDFSENKEGNGTRKQYSGGKLKYSDIFTRGYLNITREAYDNKGKLIYTADLYGRTEGTHRKISSVWWCGGNDANGEARLLLYESGTFDLIALDKPENSCTGAWKELSAGRLELKFADRKNKLDKRFNDYLREDAKDRYKVINDKTLQVKIGSMRMGTGEASTIDLIDYGFIDMTAQVK